MERQRKQKEERSPSEVEKEASPVQKDAYSDVGALCVLQGALTLGVCVFGMFYLFVIVNGLFGYHALFNSNEVRAYNIVLFFSLLIALLLAVRSVLLLIKRFSKKTEMLDT